MHRWYTRLALSVLLGTLTLFVGAPNRATAQAVFGDIIPTEKEAYEYLLGLPREFAGFSSYDCHTYEDKNILGLKQGFARRSAYFLNATASLYTRDIITVTSAYRSREEQQCVCKGESGPCARDHTERFSKKVKTKEKKKGKSRSLIVWMSKFIQGHSHHQEGIAMDVRFGWPIDPTGIPDEAIISYRKQMYACFHELAALNPQFGIHFPYHDDNPHFEPSSISDKEMEAMKHKPVTPCRSYPAMLDKHPALTSENIE